jgi:hypothetical protein
MALLAAAMMAGTAAAPPPDSRDALNPGQFAQSAAPSQQTSPVDFETEEPLSATYVGADFATVVS